MLPFGNRVRSRTMRQSGVQVRTSRNTTVPLGRIVLTGRVVQATFWVRLGVATGCGEKRALAGCGAMTKNAPTTAAVPNAIRFKVFLLDLCMATGGTLGERR
jgi:hypothetical protein